MTTVQDKTCAYCGKPLLAYQKKFCGNSCSITSRNLGSKKSAETRAKIASSRKKNWQDPEYAKKLSEAISKGMTGPNNPFYGMSHSDETKKKLSEGKKGQNHPFYGRKRAEHSELMRGMWAEGKFSRDAVSTRFSEMNRRNHEDPNFRFRNYGRGRGRSGQHVSPKAGSVQYRSSWEQCAYIMLDADPDVECYIVEPFGLPYTYNGVKHTYYPDILITHLNGTKKLVEIKPAIELLEPKVQAKIAVAKQICDEENVPFEVWTEVELGL